MISANDVLQVISEIHQYSILLLELKDSATLGILHARTEDKLNYFKLQGKLGRQQRVELVQRVYANDLPDSILSMPVEEFLKEVEGKKTRHIWLETVEPERKELGFLSVSELKSFLRGSRTH